MDGKEVASTDIDAPWMNKMRNVDKNHDGSISHPELKEYLMNETKSSNHAKNGNIQPNYSNDFVSRLFYGKNIFPALLFVDFVRRHPAAAQANGVHLPGRSGLTTDLLSSLGRVLRYHCLRQRRPGSRNRRQSATAVTSR